MSNVDFSRTKDKHCRNHTFISILVGNNNNVYSTYYMSTKNQENWNLIDNIISVYEITYENK